MPSYLSFSDRVYPAEFVVNIINNSFTFTHSTLEGS